MVTFTHKGREYRLVFRHDNRSHVKNEAMEYPRGSAPRMSLLRWMDKHGAPKGTSAAILLLKVQDSGEPRWIEVEQGESACSWSDQFSYAKGREIAFAKLRRRLLDQADHTLVGALHVAYHRRRAGRS